MPLLTTQSAKGYGLSIASAAGSNSYYQIATVQPSTSVSSYTFNSIPGTYDHLQFRIFAKDSRSPVYSSLSLRFNGDSASNYSNAFPEIDKRVGAPWLYSGTSVTEAPLFQIPGASSSTYYGSGISTIFNYTATDRHKNLTSLGGYTASGDGSYEGFCVQSTAQWRNTSAVTSITIFASANFQTGTRFSLYGIKGA
jgi:hypothetical protein